MTAAAFGALSLYGYTTKKDLSGWGSFLIMGVIGIIIAAIVNIFLQSSALQFAISVIGVLVFAGLTAYDTQRIKDGYYEVMNDARWRWRRAPSWARSASTSTSSTCSRSLLSAVRQPRVALGRNVDRTKGPAFGGALCFWARCSGKLLSQASRGMPPHDEASVRAATAADIAAITAIYRPAVLQGTASFELEPPDEPEMLRRFKAITEAGYPYFVAELDGRVVGYAYANAYRTRPAYRFTVEDSIYIAPEAQGKGIGRAAAEGADRCVDGQRLSADGRGDRRLRAITARSRLHRNAGFTFCGTIHSVGYKFGRWLDSVIMELPLGEGDKSPAAVETAYSVVLRPDGPQTAASRTFLLQDAQHPGRVVPRLRIRPVAATTL